MLSRFGRRLALAGSFGSGGFAKTVRAVMMAWSSSSWVSVVAHLLEEDLAEVASSPSPGTDVPTGVVVRVCATELLS
jgi:hypothetical protein